MSQSTQQFASTDFRVLVVDDEQITRLRLQRSLESAGYEVSLASNGLEAIQKTRAGSYDVVLCDINMPVMDGLKAVRMLRQLYTSGELPIIMMTASGDREQVLEAYDVGANDFVDKPIDNEMVLARLQNQLMIKGALQALRESEERYKLATRGTRDGIWDWNLLTGELYLSRRWQEMVGIDERDHSLHGADWLNLVHAEDRQRVMTELEAHLCGEKANFETELRMEVGDGEFRWMLCRGLAVVDKNGIAWRIAGSLSDITEGKVADAMTGLPNRLLFYDRIQKRVEVFLSGQDQQFALIYLDCDDFKLINDNLGHEVGDQFLIEVSRRLNLALANCDAIVARLGGDEFGILVNRVDSVSDAVRVAGRINDEMTKPFQTGGREIVTRGSMGIVLPECSQDMKEPLSAKALLSQADAAMYRAKQQSDSPYCVFKAEFLHESAMQLEIGNELRHSLKRREMSISYQPILNVESRTVVGFEALLRWNHPVHGEIPPTRFIPIAESNGFIVELGRWVLENACKQVNQWNKEFALALRLSVNVSLRQMKGEHFLGLLESVLVETQFPPGQLSLEVTESFLMNDSDDVIDKLNQIRNMNVQISLDDFGTGYSSLSYLPQMPIEVIKIDKSFVNQMIDCPKNMAIIRSIVALAQNLNLKIVAEGIENEKQMQELYFLGCHFAQGYLFSTPMSTEATEEFLCANTRGKRNLAPPQNESTSSADALELQSVIEG